MFQCEEECETLERELEGAEGEAGGGDEEWSLMPARGEWGAVRVLLAAPPRRAQLLSHLLQHPYVVSGDTT